MDQLSCDRHTHHLSSTSIMCHCSHLPRSALSPCVCLVISASLHINICPALNLFDSVDHDGDGALDAEEAANYASLLEDFLLEDVSDERRIWERGLVSERMGSPREVVAHVPAALLADLSEAKATLPGARSEVEAVRAEDVYEREPYCKGSEDGQVGSATMNVLVYDMGGGIIDVSLLAIEGGGLEMQAMADSAPLGGEGFDDRLVEWCMQDFRRRNHGKDIAGSLRADRCLRAQCERARRALSSATQAAIEIDSLIDGVGYSCSLSSARFVELSMGPFRNLMGLVGECLRNSGIDERNVHEVVLVRGLARAPHRMEPCASVSPGGALAFGVAALAAALADTGSAQVLDGLLSDVGMDLESAGGAVTERMDSVDTKADVRVQTPLVSFGKDVCERTAGSGSVGRVESCVEGSMATVKGFEHLASFAIWESADSRPEVPREPLASAAMPPAQDTVVEMYAVGSCTSAVDAARAGSSQHVRRRARRRRGALQEPPAVELQPSVPAAVEEPFSQPANGGEETCDREGALFGHIWKHAHGVEATCCREGTAYVGPAEALCEEPGVAQHVVWSSGFDFGSWLSAPGVEAAMAEQEGAALCSKDANYTMDMWREDALFGSVCVLRGFRDALARCAVEQLRRLHAAGVERVMRIHGHLLRGVLAQVDVHLVESCGRAPVIALQDVVARMVEALVSYLPASLSWEFTGLLDACRLQRVSPASSGMLGVGEASSFEGGGVPEQAPASFLDISMVCALRGASWQSYDNVVWLTGLAADEMGEYDWARGCA